MPQTTPHSSFTFKILTGILLLALGFSAQAVCAQGFGQTPDTGAAAQASHTVQGPAAQAPQLPPLSEGIMVSVNNDMITSYDIKQRMLLLIVSSGVQVTQETYPAFQQQALNSLIEERLQQQELDHWEVKVSKEEVDQEIERMAKQSNLTSDQLLAELKQVGVEPETLRSQISAQIGWSTLVGG
ncbi:MAG: SurA N-terminal domain-containing protein, partial [Asticcacaulis sp.]